MEKVKLQSEESKFVEVLRDRFTTKENDLLGLNDFIKNSL